MTVGIAEQRFREGSGIKYLHNGEVRCQGLSVGQIRKWREEFNDYDTPNADLWPECQCPKAATPGMFVCRFHGGRKPPKNVTSMMDVIPYDMQEKFKILLNDPIYMSRREEIALLRAREMEILEHLSDGIGNPEAWGLVSDALYELRRGNEDVAAEQLEAALKDASLQRQSWGEIIELQKLLKDVTTTEVKTAATLKTMATVDEVARLMSRVFSILTEGAKKYIDDKHQQALFLTFISGELSRAVNLSPVAIGGLLETGSGEDHRDAE